LPCRLPYIKVKGRWTYLYRTVDRNCETLDFMLSERRDLAAARRFFRGAIATHGVPDRVVIDKSGANLAGLQAVNFILKFTGTGKTVKILQVKYLNNILEQDHRFIKRITAPMMGFKTFHSAQATIAGIEIAHDPKGPDPGQWTYRLSAVYGPRGIIMSEAWATQNSPKRCDRTVWIDLLNAIGPERSRRGCTACAAPARAHFRTRSARSGCAR